MLADGGLGEWEDIDNLPADAGVALDQVFHDLYPGRVAESFADFRNLVGVHKCRTFFIVNCRLTIKEVWLFVNIKVVQELRELFGSRIAGFCNKLNRLIDQVG